MLGIKYFFTIRVKCCNFLNLCGRYVLRYNKSFLSLYPLTFFANTPFKRNVFLDRFIFWKICHAGQFFAAVDVRTLSKEMFRSGLEVRMSELKYISVIFLLSITLWWLITLKIPEWIVDGNPQKRLAKPFNLKIRLNKKNTSLMKAFFYSAEESKRTDFLLFNEP